MSPENADRKDPLDLEFNPEDEFDAPDRPTTDDSPDRWAAPPTEGAAPDPFAGLPKSADHDEPEASASSAAFPDPFAGLPKSADHDGPEAHAPSAELPDPFAGLPQLADHDEPKASASPAELPDSFAGLPAPGVGAISESSAMAEGGLPDPFLRSPISEPDVPLAAEPHTGVSADSPPDSDLFGEAQSGGLETDHSLPDPFAGLPGSEPWHARETIASPAVTAPDPFAGLPTTAGASVAESFHSDAPATMQAPNPIADMLSNAEASLGDHTVPGITIHAFCARSDMTDLVNRAQADRRMERAKVVVQDGGLGVAVDYYQNQPTPSLLIVESLDAAPQLLDYLGRLAEVCDPGTKVIVVGAANDISLYRELMRRGVSEYLVPPLTPLQLIAAITALYADPAQPFIGRQIAFCGAKGGSGASTLAHNIAHLISERMGANTVLVDLDLAFGTAGLDFNQDPLHGIADALSQPDRLDPVLMERMMARCGDHLSLFAAPANLETDFDIPAETFEEVTQKIRAATPYVVLDLPHVWNAWGRRMLVTSDDLVIVAEPDLASLRNAKNIVDLVRAARPNDAAPRVVLNKVGMPGRPEIPTKDFGEALGLTPSMVIAFDAKLFGQAANNGQMISEVGPKSKQAECLDQLARMISRREATAEPTVKSSSMLSFLFRK